MRKREKMIKSRMANSLPAAGEIYHRQIGAERR